MVSTEASVELTLLRWASIASPNLRILCGSLQISVAQVFRDDPWIEADEAAQVFPAITDDNGFAHVLAFLDGGLDILRSNVLATGGDNDVFFAAGNMQVTFWIELAQVAGV